MRTNRRRLWASKFISKSRYQHDFSMFEWLSSGIDVSQEKYIASTCIFCCCHETCNWYIRRTFLENGNKNSNCYEIVCDQIFKFSSARSRDGTGLDMNELISWMTESHPHRISDIEDGSACSSKILISLPDKELLLVKNDRKQFKIFDFD